MKPENDLILLVLSKFGQRQEVDCERSLMPKEKKVACEIHASREPRASRETHGTNFSVFVSCRSNYCAFECILLALFSLAEILGTPPRLQKSEQNILLAVCQEPVL